MNNADRVDYFGGATFVTDQNSNSRGLSLGNYLNIGIRGEITSSFQGWVLSNPIYMHEYGHTIDSQKWAPLYSFVVGIPSLISAGNSKSIMVGGLSIQEHDFKVFERAANHNAARYFEKHYGVNWTNFTPPNDTYPLRQKKFYSRR